MCSRAGAGIVIVSLALLLAPLAAAQQAERPEPLTGDPAIDAWVRTTFGQPVDRETLDDPIWGTRTLTEGQREGARLRVRVRGDRGAPRAAGGR